MIIYPKDVEEALKKIKSDEPSADIKEEKKYRTYEEIKQELDDINLAPKTDAELLNGLVKDYSAIVSESSNSEDILEILEDLEYLVHQYDNAQEFVNLNGFRKVIYKELNSTSTKVRLEVLKLLGTSMQNNPKIQIHAIETGALDILLRILSLDNNFAVKNRAVFAIGSLLRRFPLAQVKFLENAGLSVFSKLFDTTDIKLQIKIITLLNDLLLEHKSALEEVDSSEHQEKLKQYKLVHLKQRLKENNFCSLINNLLDNIIKIDKSDYDFIEKSLHIADSLSDTCTYGKDMLNNIVTFMKELKESPQDDDDDNYYQELYKIVNRLLDVLSKKTHVEL